MNPVPNKTPTSYLDANRRDGGWGPDSHHLLASPVSTYPFADVVAPCTLYYRGGRLILDPSKTMDCIYTETHTPPPAILATLASDISALPAWSAVVSSGALPPGPLRFACWLRAAPSTHTTLTLASNHTSARNPSMSANHVDLG